MGHACIETTGVYLHTKLDTLNAAVVVLDFAAEEASYATA